MHHLIEIYLRVRGTRRLYRDYIEYFQGELDKKGEKAVVSWYFIISSCFYWFAFTVFPHRTEK